MTAKERMSVAEVEAFIDKEFPEANYHGPTYKVDQIGSGRAQVRLIYHERHLRPGGTISGPSMMGLADMAAYVAILSAIGPVGLAVTTNLSINFLRKPEQSDLIAESEIIKLGKRLAVTDIRIHSEGSKALVAQVSATYSIPPNH
ncbi:MAG: PaaI family thioesterase [Fimbriimonadaceae bacterium]|nr:PaaI family thioesterase [Alphaproteobacteria bacterium]